MLLIDYFILSGVIIVVVLVLTGVHNASVEMQNGIKEVSEHRAIKPNRRTTDRK